MLSTIELLRLRVRARDGEVGSVRDLTFSDADWTVRDLDLDTGAWIFGRRVRIDPDAVVDVDAATGMLELALTREEVKALPDASTDEDILRWHESQTVVQAPETMASGGTTPAPVNPDAALHSLRDVLDYSVVCEDRPAGVLVGFLIDTVAWDLTLALVRLNDSEAMVLLPTRLITAISWPERMMQTSIEAARLRSAPAYDPRIQDERVFLPIVTDYYATHTPAA